MCDTAVNAWEGVSNFFSGGGGESVSGAYDTATNVAGTATNLASSAADTLTSAASSVWEGAKGLAGSDLGKTALESGAKAAIPALAGAIGNRGQSNFNSEMAEIMRRANTQAYNVPKPTPTPTPPPTGLIGSRGAQPAASVSSMNRPAPAAVVTPGIPGTQLAPNAPGRDKDRQQTGAIQYGVRPQMYS
jgi:hypothetical protein